MGLTQTNLTFGFPGIVWSFCREPVEDDCFLSIYGVTYQHMCQAVDSESWRGASI